MAEHPDMEKMRCETRTLRVREAWGSGIDLHTMSDNAQARLNHVVMHAESEVKQNTITRKMPRPNSSTLLKRRVTSKAKRHVSKLFKSKLGEDRKREQDLKFGASADAKFGCDVQDSHKGCIKFVCTSFLSSDAFQTSSVRILSGQKDKLQCFRTSFFIERDHTGTRLHTPFRVVGPILYMASDQKKDVRRIANSCMFDVYVHFVARMRVYLALNDVVCYTASVDSNSTEFPPSWPDVCDNKKPACELGVQAAKRLCQQMDISTEIPKMYNSSYDTSDDDEHNED